MIFRIMGVELKEPSYNGLLVNSEGTKEFLDLDYFSNYRSSNYISLTLEDLVQKMSQAQS